MRLDVYRNCDRCGERAASRRKLRAFDVRFEKDDKTVLPGLGTYVVTVCEVYGDDDACECQALPVCTDLGSMLFVSQRDRALRASSQLVVVVCGYYRERRLCDGVEGELNAWGCWALADQAGQLVQ